MAVSFGKTAGATATGAALGSVVPGVGTAIGAVGGALYGLADGLFGGDDEPPPQYQADPNAFYYGGQGADWAHAKAADYGYMGQSMAGRQAAQLDAFDAGRFQQDRAQEAVARQRQVEAADFYRNMAAGNMAAPSLAQAQYAKAQQDALAAQQSLRAGARGNAAAQAAAQRMAAMQSANLMSRGANDMAALRAQEQLGAMHGYGQLSGQMREGDLRRASQAASWAQAQAQLEAQQREMNDRAQMYYQGISHDIEGKNQSGAMSLEGLRSGNQGVYNSQMLDLQRQDQERRDKWLSAGMDAYSKKLAADAAGRRGGGGSMGGATTGSREDLYDPNK